MIVVGISGKGYREILVFKIALRETEESRKELFESLEERRLCGVELAVSDAHEGLKKASRACFPGCIRTGARYTSAATCSIRRLQGSTIR